MKNENIDNGRRGFIKTLFTSIFAGTIFSSKDTSASGKWKEINTSSSYSPLSAESPYLCDIMMVAFDWAPRCWAKCDGQVLPISSNPALFSLIGTTFGGNGVSTFNLPNLQGRSPMHAGQALPLSYRTLGDMGGDDKHRLNLLEIAEHTHYIGYSNKYGTSERPSGSVPAKNSAGVPQYRSSSNTNMGLTDYAGGNQPHDNMPPYIVTNFIFCVAGIYPSRS